MENFGNYVILIFHVVDSHPVLVKFSGNNTSIFYSYNRLIVDEMKYLKKNEIKNLCSSYKQLNFFINQ